MTALVYQRTMAEQDLKQNKTPETQPEGGKKKTKAKKIVGMIFTVLLVVVLILAVVVVVRVKTSDKPFFFGYAIYFVLTGSMEPTIKPKEVIIVREVKGEDDLAKGDIITFHGHGGDIDGRTVTHRIISDGVVNGEITTCGDANYGIADQPIHYDDVIGKYVRTSVALTTIYSIFTSKYGFLLIVVIPLLILLGVSFFNFRRACKMDKDGKTAEDKSEEEIKQEAVKAKEEEIKRKAIEEYLAGKKRLEKAQKQNKKNN